MKITFCINTARNERNHIELLFRSLEKNLSRKDHDIIVYVENDNQDTTGYLQSVAKKMFPNLTIVKNPLPIPLDYGRNINIMFEMAKTEVVSYLQSDMVIGPRYDEEILKHLTPDTIISSTRIEPPLHPPSPEKITHDFGLDPIKFDLDAFSKFAELNKKDGITNFWFAPFTMYKKVWVDIGGHDTLFRRSRVDSDILYRFSLNGIKTKQVWNALVYHFTCTSSRGIEWWTEKAQERTRLQQIADQIELARFLRKWGTFKHPNTPEEVKDDYFYRISANIHHAAPLDMSIFQNYFLFNKIYVDNPNTRQVIKTAYNNLHKPANQMHNIDDDDWDTYKKYYRLWEFEEVFVDEPVSDDVVFDIDLKGTVFSSICNNQIFRQRQEIVHAYRSEEPGEYELEGQDIKIILENPINRIKENISITNPLIDDVNLVIL